MRSTSGTSCDVGFGIAHGPRPEATALRWLELLPATQRALEELIHWLDAACRSRRDEGSAGSSSKEEQLATSALVSGDRGFGKTTILLSMSYALRNPQEFFSSRADGASSPLDEFRDKERCEKLFNVLKKLGEHIVWLDSLDMEPLPTQVNLLATLLVRVRNALDPSPEHRRRDGWAPPSLLEEGLNDPYGKIDKLVRDATFMWEDSPVQAKDPRQRAEQQIKAAEIYATFRRDFFEAMDSVSRLLAERRFGHGSQQKVLLVLPIDNVDRSIQHLHLILKLTRMVASRQLWFVLASGRSEFQLFLERSFQMELTSSGQTPLGPKSREETLSIARRQAAAAMRRVLPPIHRIQIVSVKPREAWNFEAPPPLSGSGYDARSLSHFLRKIRLPSQKEESHGLKSFADLFDLRDRLIVWDDKKPSKLKDASLLTEYSQTLREQGVFSLQDVHRLDAFIKFLKLEKNVERLNEHLEKRLKEKKTPKEETQATDPGEDELDCLAEFVNQLRTEGENGWSWAQESTPPIFSYAARLALTLSARSALDLWQSVRVAAQETENHLAQGHPLPDGSASHNPGAEPFCESCEEQPIKIAEAMLRASVDESDLPGWASEQLLNRIMRRNVQGSTVLDLTGNPIQRLKRTSLSEVLHWHPDKQKPESNHFEVLRTELHLRHFQDVILEQRDLDKPGRKVLMPSNVAGWFMLLHDLLVLTRERRVMNLSTTPREMLPELTVTLHEVLLKPPGAGKLDTELEFWWLLPSWNTFIDFVIFTMQWRAFLHRIQNLFQASDAVASSKREQLKEMDAKKFSFVMAAWIDNVCSVSGERRGGWDWTRLAKVVHRKEDADALTLTKDKDFFDYVWSVMNNIETLFARAWESRASYHRLGIACFWLDHCLPLLLGSEFIPSQSRSHFEKVLKTPPPGVTHRHWWSRHEGLKSELLNQRRYAMVLGEVEHSRAYKLHKKRHDKALGADALSLYGWLSRACEEWITSSRAAKGKEGRGKQVRVTKVPEQGRVVQKGRLRLGEAVHREVRAPARRRRRRGPLK
ncbi:hypothetical protein F0U60_08600 [Archangium minus]|uniref:Uncharacterized protein n=1 Tax=Archangium minus TaxID=83450 RepID=A0ABY9WLN1_9BACT|nr:hypothetical protein F0U60_08600 [Archangium minus]